MSIEQDGRPVNKPVYEIPVSDAPLSQFAPPQRMNAPVPPAPPAQASPVTDFSQFPAPSAYAPPVAAPMPQDPIAAFVAAAPAGFPPFAPTAFPPAPPLAFIADEFTVAARARSDADLLDALESVLNLGASDLHVSAGAPPLLRIDGALRPVDGQGVWDRERVAAALYSLLSDEQRAKFDDVLELDFAFTLSENARFRVNFYLQRGAVGGAFRLIPTEIKTLPELGMPDVVEKFARLARGLVLVTGPTGSGKSTTLAALIDLVNQTRTDHIVTVEDPIEFLHTNKKSLVNQREVGDDTQSFASALKHVLRQDPDVILIGELRDLETISVALTAAETGHLVFATLHTQDAPQTIDRIIDVFPPHQQPQVRAQLAATLQGVVCQTLVRRAGGSGRVAATEVMVTTPAVANLIREGKTYQIISALQAGAELGMHTLDQNLAELVNSGVITQDAAMERVHDSANFGRLVRREPAGPLSDSFEFGDFSRATR